MNVSLVLVRDDGRQQDVPLKKATQVIGRATDCGLRIPSSSVSRHHCEVVVGEGKATLRDLGSSNGTYVNRKKVATQDLAAGDLISIGEFVFVVRVDGDPKDVDAEESYDEGIVLPPKAAPASAAPAPAAKQAAKPGVKPAAPAAKPAPKKDDDEDDLLSSNDPDDSSVADFDFLDEDDDLKKQPKL
ncbi:MAG TPA: FHA domain-containing protein [Phycisphaerales bacterium]|nr:FHA domain-containing protein [Phycisphaerales bacterium]